MKRLILTLLFAFGMIAATFAQTKAPAAPVVLATSIGGTKLVDTTDNTETNYLYYRIPSSAKSLSLQVIGTKISGAPNGCFTVEYSLTPFSASNFVAISAADTLHMSNSATPSQLIYTKTLTVNATLPYVFVRVKSVGRGTASYKFVAYAWVTE